MEKQEDFKLNTHSAVYYHWRVWELTGLMRPPGVSSLLYVVYSITVNLVVTVLFP